MHTGKDGLAIDKILEYAEKEFAVPEPEKQYAVCICTSTSKSTKCRI